MTMTMTMTMMVHRCEDTSQNQCPRQQGYGQGHGYCKNIKTKVDVLLDI